MNICCNFGLSELVTYYNRLLNEPGFNLGAGPGCAAEYFLEQSRGLFHVEFDIIGPQRIDLEAQHTPANQNNYGTMEKIQAIESLSATYPDIDFSVYDWNGDGMVEQIIYICTGLCADVGGYDGARTQPNGSMTSCRTSPLRLFHPRMHRLL